MTKWLLLCCVWLCCACEDGDSPPDTTAYEIVVGDTLITISVDAVNFANTHFSWDAYMLREFQMASSTQIPSEGAAFSGSLPDWKNLPWVVRETFLFVPYGHDAATSSRELFYYIIGTHFDQFGFGWKDTYDPEANIFDESERPWNNPADTTLAVDNPGTLNFDGESNYFAAFRGMWEF
ncbi:MAG: hypothetical protein IPG71_09810 [bacterium]|nr:hypothetical protein [bacterium]